MPLDLNALGATAEQSYEYDWRETVLYALALGTRTDDLDYLYEGLGPKVLPTFPVVAAFSVFKRLVERIGGDSRGAVHLSQSLRLHAPVTSAARWVTQGRVTGVYDRRRYGQSCVTTSTFDERGSIVCEMEWWTLHRFDGGFGGPRPPDSQHSPRPTRNADFTLRISTSKELGLVYRLLGDFNSLHADPLVAEAAGFRAPLLHGLCTFGLVGRMIVASLGGGQPEKLLSLSGEFRHPMFPGEDLTCELWSEGPNARVRATRDDGAEVFSNGIAHVAET